ncbi:MAG: methyl-accepting chemotaxis protein [Alphaproteobacteria bacterium]
MPKPNFLTKPTIVPKETISEETNQQLTPSNDIIDKRSEYVQALKNIQDCHHTPFNDPSDPVYAALDELAVESCKTTKKALERLVELSVQSSESLASTSFVTGDLREIAANTQNIAAAVEQLSTTSDGISQNTKNIAENSQLTQEAISQGHSAVESSVESMDLIAGSIDTANTKIQNLSESVEAIVEILATIENIAKQTNLLALNATIEAARAGEAGKGFAVVATEVKTLASQTAEATEDIKDKINAISTGMNEVSNAMIESVGATDSGRSNINKAGEEIKKVVENIAQMTNLIDSVAHNVIEENKAIREIGQSIESIKEKTNESAANAESAVTITTQTAQIIDKQLAQYAEMDIPDAIFDFAKSDHIAWKKKLAAMLVGKDSLTAAELSDHHSCRLGKWYYAVQDPKVRNHPSFAQMEAAHESVHAHGKECARLFEAGDRQAAADEYKKMTEASKTVFSLLDNIKRSVTGK